MATETLPQDGPAATNDPPQEDGTTPSQAIDIPPRKTSVTQPTTTDAPDMILPKEQAKQDEQDDDYDSDDSVDPYGHLTYPEMRELADRTGDPDIIDRLERPLERGLERYMRKKAKKARLGLLDTTPKYHSTSPASAMRWLASFEEDTSSDEENVLELPSAPKEEEQVQQQVEEDKPSKDVRLDDVTRESEVAS